MSEPEKGDKVSWNWGSGAPGGTVAEKKKEGEVAVSSKKGNKIKKNAEPSNPAIAIERSGNNVVKKASELNVEKKASGGGDNKRKKEEKEEDAEDGGDATVENDEGKEVRPAGKTASKKQKTDTKQTNGDSEAKSAGKGRPKKGEGKAKEKKPSKPRDTAGVSGRTRSRA